MRFLVGVQLRRAAILLLAGFAVGLAAGGSIVATGVAAGLPSVLRAPTVAGPVADDPAERTPSVPPAASSAPASPVTGEAIPAAARSALPAVAAANERLADGRSALEATLTAATFDVAAAAVAIRSVAAEAAAGSDQLARLATWPRAAPLAGELRAFYDDLRSTARSGLAYSITDGAAYRATAEALATILDGLPALDARLAVLLEAARASQPNP
jgi:hypothetical protein